MRLHIFGDTFGIELMTHAKEISILNPSNMGGNGIQEAIELLKGIKGEHAIRLSDKDVNFLYKMYQKDGWLVKGA